MFQRRPLFVCLLTYSRHFDRVLICVVRTGEMAYSFAKGLQEQGVSATIKHFVRQLLLIYSEGNRLIANSSTKGCFCITGAGYQHLSGARR